MSFASICAITAALFVLGLVLVAVFNLNHIVAGIESKVEVTVFLRNEALPSDISLMEQQLRRWDGVYDIDYISKAEALENWRQEWGEKQYLLDGYGPENNPLPNSFLIKVEKPEFVDNIVEKASVLPYAEKVQYSKDVVDYIGKIAATTHLIGLVVVIILMVMATIIIGNTIKITVYSRRREINIMKYIGATDWFIRWPFIIEGLMLGFLGAIAAGGFTAGMYQLLVGSGSASGNPETFLSMFRLLPLEDILFQILAVFFVVGGVVGLSAGCMSIHRHLKV